MRRDKISCSKQLYTANAERNSYILSMFRFVSLAFDFRTNIYSVLHLVGLYMFKYTLRLHFYIRSKLLSTVDIILFIKTRTEFIYHPA